MEEEWIELSNGKRFIRKVYSKYTKEELSEVIACCRNLKDIVETMRINMFYYKYLTKFISENNIDTSHFINKLRSKTPRKIEELLTKDSKGVCSKILKNHIVNKQIVKNECSVCKLPPVWNNKPLTLQLDHINGDHFDNRVENLRLICPNCHTQTDTYTGRNTRKYAENKCKDCNKELRTDNLTQKCLECIQKSKHLCSLCGIVEKYNHYSKCKACLKIDVSHIKCKGCGEQLKKNTNTSGYHKKCFKLSKIEKDSPKNELILVEKNHTN